MDLNPYEFTAPYEKKEFSNFCKEKDVDLVIFLTNWLNGDDEDVKKMNESEERSFELLNYWLDRCSPLLNKKTSYFLAANRCGMDQKTKFAGSSCILKLCEKPKLIDKLTIGEENALLACIEF
jgi:protein N-terminal amidase